MYLIFWSHHTRKILQLIPFWIFLHKKYSINWIYIYWYFEALTFCYIYSWLQSGKVYLQRCNSSNLPSTEYRHQNQPNQTVPRLQDLNFPPSPPAKPLLNLFDDGTLELKLVSSSSSSSSTNYQSVCTLDKVKSALERAEKEPNKRRSPHGKSSMSPSYSSSSSSIREAQEDQEKDEKLLALPVAVGCPGCLSYVLITKNNPKCPRCNSIVPLPATKKPRIDLNMSIWDFGGN